MSKLVALYSRNSLASRTLLPLSLVSFIGICLLGFIVYKTESRRYEESAVAQLRSFGQFVSDASVSVWTNYDLAGMEALVTSGLKATNVRYIVYLDKGVALTKTSKRITDKHIEKLKYEIKSTNGNHVAELEIGYDLEAGRTAILKGAMASFFYYLIFFCVVFGVILLTIRKLVSTISGIRDSLMSVSQKNHSGSELMIHATEIVSTEALQQSSAVQQSAAALAEMQSMLENSLKNVYSAKGISQQIVEKTNLGGASMNDLERNMRDLQSTRHELDEMEAVIRRIKQKTDVINDIVFKTQLLSFNASIEAARAGQHGRGFAVVATEIGNLSNISGAAAKEIDSLIAESVTAVHRVTTEVSQKIVAGETAAKQAMKNFAEIANGIKDISSAVESIGDANAQQVEGITQTNLSMDQLNTAAHNNSKAISEILSLARDSKKLSFVVQQSSFELDKIISGDESSTRSSTSQKESDSQTPGEILDFPGNGNHRRTGSDGH